MEMEHEIYMKQDNNNFFSRARSAARQDTCIYCGEKGKPFCRSHSVPQNFLKNIAVNGEVYRSNYLTPICLLDTKAGVKKAGTFQLICRDCDKHIFLDYENQDNYKNQPSQKIMAQIAMKNYLLFINKRHIEREGYKDQFSRYSFFDEKGINRQLDIIDQDLRWYRKCFYTAKERSLGYDSHEYHSIYYNKVNYLVPIAFQIAIPIIYDLHGAIINDTYNLKSNYHLWDLHICIFPFKDSSAILLFVDTHGLKRYANFIQQFEELSDSDKIALINYIIFLYCEDIYLAPDIPKDVWDNDNLRRISHIGINNTVIQVRGITIFGDNSRELTPKKAEEYNLRKFKDIPNLLSYEYRVQRDLK